MSGGDGETTRIGATVKRLLAWPCYLGRAWRGWAGRAKANPGKPGSSLTVAPPTGRQAPQVGGHSALMAWLCLLRVPNLFTVPGDPLAGFLLAGGALSAGGLVFALPCCLASLLLYCAGLLANDYFDLAQDRRDRPDRPLPAGQVRPRTVLIVALVLAGLGIAAASSVGGTCGAILAAVLAAAIFLYDMVGKRIPVFGPLNMGACRGLSLLLGAAAVGRPGTLHPSPWVLISACGLTAYIAAVTAVAAWETRRGRVGLRRWLPPAAILCWMALLSPVLLVWVPSAVLQILAAGWALTCAQQLRGDPAPQKIQKTVGGLVRGLLLVQASVVVAWDWQGAWNWERMAAACVLLAAWPASTLAARKFYAS